MKKQILSLAIAALALTPLTSFAQAQNAAPQTKNAVKGNRQDKDVKAPNPFEGLNLTAEQQSKLDALAAERKAARENEKQAARDKRSKADAAKKAERRAARKAELDKIKAILTPEQYVTYLENMVLDGKGGKKGDKHKGNRERMKNSKDGKGKQGQRGQKGQRPNASNGAPASK